MEHNQMTSITRRSLTLGLGASAALAAASPPMVADAAWQRTVLPSVRRNVGYDALYGHAASQLHIR
jgi:hypothetical protein